VLALVTSAGALYTAIASHSISRKKATIEEGLARAQEESLASETYQRLVGDLREQVKALTTCQQDNHKALTEMATELAKTKDELRVAEDAVAGLKRDLEASQQEQGRLREENASLRKRIDELESSRRPRRKANVQ